MKNILILHGAGNDSQGNWFPWLKSEMEKKGYKAWCPDLPNTESPNLEEWLDTIFANKDWEFNEESVIVGHSAGATLILRILERIESKIDKAILVAASIDKGQYPEFFHYKESVTKNPYEWQKIKGSCNNFYFLASDNDPYDCGERHAKVMQENLGGETIIKEGQGHFNVEVSENYRQFPLLVELIG